jgi:hypothetical protein
MMRDEEVGAHFKLIQLGQEFFHLNIHVMPFIEKLVQERTEKIYYHRLDIPPDRVRVKALLEFGITVEEWENRTQFKL